MRLDRVDKFIIGIGAIFLIALIGMVWDVWQLVYYTIPVLTVVLIVLGAMDHQKRKSTDMTLIFFGFISIAVFIWAGVGMTSLEPTFWGLSLGAGVFVYVIWPLTTISGFIYSIINRS